MIKLTHKPLKALTVTSKFGYRNLTVQKKDISGMHKGVDFKSMTPEPVYAAHSGTVRFVGENDNAGKYVIVQHSDGWETHYYHLSRYIVRTGQVVLGGQQIALTGKTGFVDGPHLHFGLFLAASNRNGQPVDPMPYFAELDKKEELPEGVKRKDFQINGKLYSIKTMMVDGENYPNFKEICDAFGYKVDYDASKKLPIAKK